MKRQAKMWERFDAEFKQAKVAEESELCGCGGKQCLDDGALTCVECGTMVAAVDLSAEWRYYGEDSYATNPTRCGMPINPLLRESSMGCNVLSVGSSSYEMLRIQRHIRWTAMPYKEKARYDEFQRIATMAGISGMPKMIIDEACNYHKQISERQTFRGDNRDGIIAASIYIACRVENNPRTAKEIARIFQLDTASATKGCKNAMAIINELESEGGEGEALHYSNTNPHAFIERYCSRLGVSAEMTKVGQFIALQIEKNNLVPENTPHSVAAGIIYFLADHFGLNITKLDVKAVSEISEVTITKCFKKIESLRDKILPQVIYDKYRVKNVC
jgi:transcription initiation factor TFIIB